jgi:CheY-like chemotaxis protein
MSKKILIIEDEQALQDLYADLLSDYDLSFADNGKRALELVNQHYSADMYLLDIGLPDMDGFDVMTHIRQKNPSAKVMIVTGYPLQSINKKIVSGRPSKVLTKPFEIEDFLTSVQQLVLAT